MNRPNIDKEVYNRYVDATVALFMEYYSASLTESIQKEISVNNDEGIVFPEELDNRCRTLIKRECIRCRHQQYLKGILKGFRYVASISVILLSLSSFLFMTVEAFRIPIINYYIEQHNGHWEISDETVPDSHTNNSTINFQNPLINLLPDDYQLVVLDGDSLNKMAAIYENSSGNRICFSAVHSEHWIAIDSENAQVSHQHKFCGYDAITVVKDGVVSLTWIHADLTTVFTLIADDMSQSEVIAIGTQFIDTINK